VCRSWPRGCNDVGNRSMTKTSKGSVSVTHTTFYSFNGKRPQVAKSAFIHPDATIIGDVTIGRNVFIGAGAVLRGDWGTIRIGDGCNVQENCVLHTFPNARVILKKNAHIGHATVIHGGIIGKNALIGMNCVIMDDCVIGDNSIIGALTFVPSEMRIPSGKVAVGNPARVVKDVSKEMLRWKKQGTKLYQTLPKMCKESLVPCEPSTKSLKRPKGSMTNSYKTWKKTARSKR